MGRKNRSSSLGSVPTTPPTSSLSLLHTPSSYAAISSSNNGSGTALANTSSTPSSSGDGCLLATRELIRRFLFLEGNTAGSTPTPFHDIVSTAAAATAVVRADDVREWAGWQAKKKKREDALYLLEGLCRRTRELDHRIMSMVSRSGSSSSSNASSLTPSSIETSDGICSSTFDRLLLTKDTESGYTPLHVAIYNRDITTMLLLLGHADDNTATTFGSIHPLQLLDDRKFDDRISTTTFGSTNNYSSNNMGTTVIAKMARSVDHEGLSPIRLLGRTSEKDLKHCRASLLYNSWGEKIGDTDNVDDDRVDHHALGEVGRRNRNNARVGGGQRRGGSFDLDLHYHDELEQPQQPRDVDDIDINFDMLGDDINHHEGIAGGLGLPKPSVRNTGDDYGCEVLTFGRADHCALGVLGGGGGGVGGLTTIGCHKPKRVEAFGLGDLRRNCLSSSAPLPSLSPEDTRYNDYDVTSSAVAVAASTHHTLVLTRTGRLFAFGYGKSGRLGTGDARNRNLPVRILGRLTRRVVTGIAAAEDHSLCCTDDGAVFSWGSNGFGQLGHSLGRGSGGSGIDNQNNDDDATIVAGRMSPRRVEAGGMKQSFVVSVAAGDRHSVALTRLGEVYCWGDNRSGQLGIYSNSGDRCCQSPTRVEGLWTARPPRRAIAIAASEFSTLVLTVPPTSGGEGQASLSSLPVNTVYGWGHGNHSVMRVEFPTAAARNSTQQADNYARSTGINPTAIASAKFHNVAITSDGEVFTWGIQKDSLGNEKDSPAAVGASKRFDSEWATASENRRPRSNSNTGLGTKKSSSSSVISSPQLVVGMLPENGGGKAIAVSASESHTAIVTADGYLFTWGTSTERDVMGHRGVNWLQTPRKVKRVHRAVGVAAAKEHTVLLMATTLPPLPFANPTCSDKQPLSLQECAAIEISRNVDLFNVLPIALVARRLNCRPLMHFCDEFTRKNLDGVLAVGNKNDFTTFITSVRSAVVGGVRIDFDLDGPYHPFFYQLANYEIEEDNLLLLNKYARSIMHAQKKVKKRLVKEERRPSKYTDKKVDENKSYVSCDIVKVDAEKTVLTSDKKSVRVSFLEGEGDDQLMPPTKLFDDKGVITSKAVCGVADTSKFRCEVCNVSCPDSDSYTLHMTGRKHRNRLMHANKEEEKRVAEAMMEMKRMQLMEKMCNDDENNHIAISNGTALENKKPKSAWGNSAPIKPSMLKVRTKSFQEILLEEQQRSLKSNKQPKGMMSTPTTIEQPRLSNALTPTISEPSLTLSAFIKQSGGHIVKNTTGSTVTPSATKLSAKKVNSVGPTGWGAKKDGTEHSKPSATKSFSEIQQEEETFRSNEDHMCRIEGNQWFVAQRERAASIGEIQEQEKKDREIQERIEEQKQIERDIMDRARQEKMNIHIKKPRKKRHVHKSGNEKPIKNP